MKKKVINHLNNHINKYVLGLFISIILTIFLSKFIPDYIKDQQPDDYSYLKEVVIDMYNIDSNLLDFDENNIAILKMDDMYIGVEKNNQSYSMPPIYNENFEQCAGYIIVKKIENNSLDIDISSFCDMIDY